MLIYISLICTVQRSVLVFVPSSRRLELRRFTPETLRQQPSSAAIDTLSISNAAASATSTLLAYRPNYRDVHGSNLGALFFNIAGIWPCLQPVVGTYIPMCHLLSAEEDGFRDGKVIIPTGDRGTALRIFSSTQTLPTFGIAVQDCPQLTPACLHNGIDIVVSCQLPRQHCEGSV